MPSRIRAETWPWILPCGGHWWPGWRVPVEQWQWIPDWSMFKKNGREELERLRTDSPLEEFCCKRESGGLWLGGQQRISSLGIQVLLQFPPLESGLSLWFALTNKIWQKQHCVSSDLKLNKGFCWWYCCCYFKDGRNNSIVYAWWEWSRGGKNDAVARGTIAGEMSLSKWKGQGLGHRYRYISAPSIHLWWSVWVEMLVGGEVYGGVSGHSDCFHFLSE